jgi:glycolate oxidase iron-sulfur subunit
MRAVADARAKLTDDVRRHLDLCLDCRACETACPSGVQYGRLIEPFKVGMQETARSATAARPNRFLDFILQHLFPYANRVRLALAPARWAQQLGLIKAAERTGVIAALPESLRRLVESLPEKLQRPSRLPEFLPALGPRRARVALFTGCVADAMAPETNAATARVLQRNGCDVFVPRSQACCGAIHYHAGHEAPALSLARKNLSAFDLDKFDAIIVNVAGCGAMLKDYAHLLPDSDAQVAARFVSKVRDVSEFLDELGIIPPQRGVDLRATYHDACHLCHAQRVRSAPRTLLSQISGLVLVPLEESDICCGAAGTYNLTQPEMSQRLGERKADRIIATDANVVVMGNIGCQLQIARALRAAQSPIEVVHTIELLDRAYGAESPSPLAAQ